MPAGHKRWLCAGCSLGTAAALLLLLAFAFRAPPPAPYRPPPSAFRLAQPVYQRPAPAPLSAPPPPPPPPPAPAPAPAPVAAAPAAAAPPRLPRAPPPPPPADYRSTQFQATPFPPSYESRLVRAARALGVDVPDPYSRHRAEGGGYGVCPPHDAGGGGGGGGGGGALPVPSLDALAGLTGGLVVVSYDAPRSLEGAMASWAEGGLLDLVDDRVAFLNAPLPEEVALSLGHGFRVYTPAQGEVAPLLARHRAWLSQFDHHPASGAFPPVRNHAGDPARPATWVAPAQIMAYLEMATDIVIFAEKDYALAPAPVEHVVRSLLAAVAMIASNTAVVRLRRLDDENREALPDCCAGVCGNSFSDFRQQCSWGSHLDWLAIFCDTAGVEARSKGAVKKCMDEGGGGGGGGARVAAGAAGVAVEPLRAYCFSMDHSGWSNNVAMFRREWWIAALGHGAVLTEGDNGMFEVNMVMLCDYVPKKGLGGGADKHQRAGMCQLAPGIFVHKEFDGFVYK